jgi:hypothetical protein
VLGGPHSQALLDVVIEVADGDAGHGGAPVLEQAWTLTDDCNAITESAKNEVLKSLFIFFKLVFT